MAESITICDQVFLDERDERNELCATMWRKSDGGLIETGSPRPSGPAGIRAGRSASTARACLAFRAKRRAGAGEEAHEAAVSVPVLSRCAYGRPGSLLQTFRDLGVLLADQLSSGGTPAYGLPDYGLCSWSRDRYGRTLCPPLLSRMILSVPPRTRSMVSRYMRLRVTSGAFLYSS